MRARKADFDAVEAVLEKFVEAIHKSDSTIVAPYFVESAHLYGNAGGNTEQEPISTLLRNIDGLGELGAGVNFRTDILALEETVAVACMPYQKIGHPGRVRRNTRAVYQTFGRKSAGNGKIGVLHKKSCVFPRRCRGPPRPVQIPHNEI